MVRVFAVLLLLGLAGPGEQRRATAPQNASGGTADAKRARAEKRALGDDIVKTIKKAKRINIYHLAAFVADADSERPAGKTYFADYEVLDSNKVEKKNASRLKKILLDESNYLKAGDTNKCTFTATVGLEIVSKKGAVTVLVSYRCEKILFIRNGKELYRDVKSLEPFDEVAHGLLKGQRG